MNVVGAVERMQYTKLLGTTPRLPLSAIAGFVAAVSDEFLVDFDPSW